MEKTFSFEWELLLLKPDGLPAEKSLVLKVAHAIQRDHPELRVGTDFLFEVNATLLELRMGIVRDLPEFRGRVLDALDSLRRACQKEKLLPVISGTVPNIGGVLGLHIHVGTFYDLEALERRIQDLIYWSPVWLAMAVSSPINPYRPPGRHQSLRMWVNAGWACSPYPAASSLDVQQWSWGIDIMDSGLERHPTLQIRVADAPISPAFLLEFVPFVVAHVLSGEAIPLTPQRYLEYLINRYQALTFGLRAQFHWLGEVRPVSDLVLSLLHKIPPTVQAQFSEFGEFPLLTMMAEKRVTQADMVLALYSHLQDPWALTYELGKLMTSEDPFPEFVKRAAPRDPAPLMDLSEMLLDQVEAVAPRVFIWTHTRLPVVVFERVMADLVREGRLRELPHPEGQTFYFRGENPKGT